MSAEIPLNLASRAVTATGSAVPQIGLPAEIASWLHATHEQLAREIARIQRVSSSSVDEEATIAIETLPQATRQFLWLGIRRHHPALAELIREPLIAQARTMFDAQLHLYVTDLLNIISAAVATERAVSADRCTI